MKDVRYLDGSAETVTYLGPAEDSTRARVLYRGKVVAMPRERLSRTRAS